MKILKTNKTMYFDVDDTLIIWHPNQDDMEKTIDIEGFNVLPFHENITRLHKHKTQGYHIVVWSDSGWEWAAKVVSLLEIEHLVDEVRSKPSYYVDDLCSRYWAMSRIYVPKKGYEHLNKPHGWPAQISERESEECTRSTKD